jgi:hypothetical protein
MGNPLEALGVTQAQLLAAMNSDEVRQQMVALAEEAAAYWRSVSPVDEGDYVDSVHVETNDDGVKIVASDPKSHWIEYGTEDTAESAPRAKTQTKFGGANR